jgi:hypothetical protein
MKIKEGFMLREVAGSQIVVPVGKASESFRGMITLNTTGAFIWKQLQNETDEDSIVKALLDTYDIKEEQAKEDVGMFITKMMDNNLLEM